MNRSLINKFIVNPHHEYYQELSIIYYTEWLNINWNYVQCILKVFYD